jgi:UDP-glucose 4-epimerase
MQYHLREASMSNLKVLVTGGAGFVGSHLSEKLISLGHQVHIVDDLSTGNIQNVPKKANLHVLDIRNREKVRELFAEEQFPVIFHQAAQMSVLRSVKRPVMDASINVIGTLNLLEAGRDNHLQKIIFASSGVSSTATPTTFPKTKNTLEPISPYGLSKLSVEKYLRYFGKPRHRIYCTSLRQHLWTQTKPKIRRWRYRHFYGKDSCS